MNILYNRNKFYAFVFKKLKGLIKYHDVRAVVFILLDEIKKDLISGKNVEIKNFGTLYLRSKLQRKHYSLIHKKVIVSPGKKILFFNFATNVKKFLLARLDVDKTFDRDDNDKES